MATGYKTKFISFIIFPPLSLYFPPAMFNLKVGRGTEIEREDNYSNARPQRDRS